MSIFDDDRPKKPLAHEIGSDLSMLSVDELKARIALLQAEIERLETECASKASGRKAAENLFRS
ncbi:DUF1192 domain-containing protein [Rhizobium tubonense]|jgi:uncharacterized small protein (DUF1192 family)|uniref:DUF1192 domain-containing protein n=1 Tax=Rhizobium tubonense TaxID=484088 RepID=A0A2W4C8E9_9HYPH|nr:DUF1192 domain-containing protein [Rhizobium tubonense]PZM07658.1 hypothetical protein CPY51_31550 [Rhizobium tubonense]